jgi:hypothetical protein
MSDADKRVGTRRGGKDRRDGLDTRSNEERCLVGERRSGDDRRSGKDRRFEAPALDPSMIIRRIDS